MIKINYEGLQNLLSDVVAYVEYRDDMEDISLEIAREIKKLGVKISDKRDCKVTHVIFKNGTLRTSNWAKKHGIPLVAIGWLANCGSTRTKLLHRPWLIPYIEEPVDKFGLRKKMKSKRYFKAMNVEELEEEMRRKKEKQQKLLDKSLNNSKLSNSSFSSAGSSESEERLKIAKQIQIPDYHKKFQERIEKRQLRGNRSISDSTSEQQHLDDKELRCETKEINGKNNNDNHIANSSTTKKRCTKSSSRHFWESQEDGVDLDSESDNSGNKYHNLLQLTKARDIVTSDSSILDSNEKSIKKPKPFLNESNKFSLKDLLPDAVKKTALKFTENSPLKTHNETFDFRNVLLDTSKKHCKAFPNKKPLKRSTISNETDENKPEAKRPRLEVLNGSIDDLTLVSQHKTAKVNNAVKCDRNILTPNNSKPNMKQCDKFNSPKKLKSTEKFLNEEASTVKLNSSPLLKDVYRNGLKSPQPSTSSLVDAESLITPTKKRVSLRTRILKKSVETKKSKNLNRNNKVLVPDTQLVPKQLQKNPQSHISSNTTPSDSNKSKKIIYETPLQDGKLMSKENHNSNNCIGESFSFSIFESPNVQNYLKKRIPNFKESEKQGHVLFVPKDNYYHCSKSITPLFKRQKAFINNNLSAIVSASVGQNPPSLIPNPKDVLPIVIEEKCEEQSPSETKTVNTRRSKRLTNKFDISPQNLISEIFNPSPAGEKSHQQQQQSNAGISSASPADSLPSGSSYKHSLTSDIFKAPTNHINSEKQQTVITISPNEQNEPLLNQKKNCRKRPWCATVEKQSSNDAPIIKNEQPIIKQKKKSKIRNSLDDFIIEPPTVKDKISVKSRRSLRREIVLIGFDEEEQMRIRSLVRSLPDSFIIKDIIRTKEQLVLLPKSPRRSIAVIKALILGNTFVSVDWIDKSIEANRFVEFSPFIVNDYELIEMPSTPATIIDDNNSQRMLFAEYAPMFISPIITEVPKYKLRIIIEYCGGRVTESHRSAGVVIGTKKVNAMSVRPAWIIDSFKQSRILDPVEYEIL